MAEPRGNHLNIDGGQVKDDEHIASYKPVSEFDTEKPTKASLSKSKERLSSDGAEEKLLHKEDEAKITTRVDMADAKYVVGDHRNGDAKIELDANKKNKRLIPTNKMANGAGDMKGTEPSDKNNSNKTFNNDQTVAGTSKLTDVRKENERSNSGTTEVLNGNSLRSPVDQSKQFAGLTKEELMKFADDPFWVRLRWFMFILFWVLWLAMLGGAIAIIICAPKCAPPAPKTWYQKGPLIDSAPQFASDILQKPDLLDNIGSIGAQGLFVTQDDPYKVLDDPSALDEIKAIVEKAKALGVKVIVDLSASFVLKDHTWFQLAVNRTEEYANYFIWAVGTDYDEATGHLPQPPNNWVSKVNTPAWSWDERRKEFYYHQFADNKPQLNFTNPAVVKQFDEVIRKYMTVGVSGLRLDARDLLVDPTLPNEQMSGGTSALRSDLSQYDFWRHQHTSDQPALQPLLQHWAHLVDTADGGNGNTVFTVTEHGGRPELYLLNRDVSFLRPPSAAPLDIERRAAVVAQEINERVKNVWPSLELTLQGGESNLEAAAFSALLPAAPVLKTNQFEAKLDNVSKVALESFTRLLALREDASINHGNYSISTVVSQNTTDELLVCARWKPGHTGYVAVWNPSDELLTADLTAVTSVPPTVTLHYASPDARAQMKTLNGQAVETDKMLIPPKSTVVFSYVPNTTTEK